MTSSTKSVYGSGSGVLIIETLDLPDAWSHDPASSFAQSFASCDPSVHDRIDAAGRDTHSPTNVGNSNDHVIRSLSSALEIVELESDGPCAEALRRAIAARLAGSRVENQPLAYCGTADNRRSIRALQKWRLKRVTEYVDTNLSNKVSLLDMAAVAGLSRMHFASQFRAATGLRPHEFLLRRRIRRSGELLRTSPMTIVEIALTVGFQTQAHFTTVFKRFAGCTPRQWRTASQIPADRQTENGASGEATAGF